MNLKITADSNDDHSRYRSVFLDEVYVGEADDGWGKEGERDYHISFRLEETELLSNYTINDLFKNNIYSCGFPIDINKYENLNWINVESSSTWFFYGSEYSVLLIPNFLMWDKPIGVATFFVELEKYFGDNNDIHFKKGKDPIEEGISFSGKIDNDEGIIDELNRVLDLIYARILLIFEKHAVGADAEHLVNVYTFPPEIRPACEQYLIYFSRFLEDIGISALANIESHPKKTYFTVKPQNSDEALSNIKEMLDVYLSLPQFSDLDVISKEFKDVSVQQLISNIYHLKSQLLLATSVIESKNATIDSLKFTNYQKSILIDSKSESDKNEEEIFDGLVTLNEFKGKGFKINLPEIFRRLKRQFK